MNQGVGSSTSGAAGAAKDFAAQRRRSGVQRGIRGRRPQTISPGAPFSSCEFSTFWRQLRLSSLGSKQSWNGSPMTRTKYARQNNWRFKVLQRVAEKENAEAKAPIDFTELTWGLAFSASNSFEDAFESATIVKGIVRVEKDQTMQTRILLEFHQCFGLARQRRAKGGAMEFSWRWRLGRRARHLVYGLAGCLVLKAQLLRNRRACRSASA